MGMMVDGEWKDDRQLPTDDKGRFQRKETSFRNWVTADGSAGPSGEGGFKAEAGRYHLYVSLACPWAHRTLIFRKLKGLEDAIGLSVVHWHMGADGWTFEDGQGVIPDPIHGARFLRDVYKAADDKYTGRVTVPVLWDKERETIVSNESAEIIRMFNSAFEGIADDSHDFYPEGLRAAIDEINAPVYESVNNGVYKSGFARSQAAYDEAVTALFATLDMLEDRLSRQRYLVGDAITEADWRLFTTLVRFDPVYHGHFKCNIRRIYDYPNLWNYTKELYQWPGVAETVDLFHIKNHYYGSHESVNPTGIVPIGPDIDYSAPHDRGRLAKAA
jgi:putative glutathione S-transferase